MQRASCQNAELQELPSILPPFGRVLVPLSDFFSLGNAGMDTLHQHWSPNSMNSGEGLWLGRRGCGGDHQSPD